MLHYALSQMNLTEVRGQVLRLIVTLPGHALGKVPQGNVGWSFVGLTEEMPVPEDILDCRRNQQ